MNFVNHVFLLATAVLLFVLNQSNALPVDDAAKYVLSQRFQDNQEKLIAVGNDRASILARSAIGEIYKAADQCLAEGCIPEAVQIATDGILRGIRLVAAAQRNVIASIKAGFELAKVDPDAGVAAVKNGIKKITDLIYVAGVPIHHSQGAAQSIAGKAAKEHFEKSIVSIQYAGTSVFRVLETSESIACIGITAGEKGLEKAEEAAVEAIETGIEAVYNFMSASVKHTFEGIKAGSMAGSGLINLVTGVAESLDDDVSTDVPDALNAVDELNAGLVSVLNNLPVGCLAEAIKTLIQGVNRTIKRSANAMKIAKKSLQDALKLADQDTGAAIATMQKGIQTAMHDILRASADGYLGIGGAGQISGNIATEGLIPVTVGFETGRVTGYIDVELAGNIATIGFNAGGKAAQLGVEAALQTVSAAENALYTHLANAGVVALHLFRSL